LKKLNNMDLNKYSYEDLINYGGTPPGQREYPLDMYSTKDVVDHFGYEQLINEIGIEKVELYLRNLKIKKIKNNL